MNDQGGANRLCQRELEADGQIELARDKRRHRRKSEDCQHRACGGYRLQVYQRRVAFRKRQGEAKDDNNKDQDQAVMRGQPTPGHYRAG